MEYSILAGQQYVDLVVSLITSAEGMKGATVTNLGDGKATIGYGYTFGRNNNLALWQAAGIPLTASEIATLQAIDNTVGDNAKNAMALADFSKSITRDQAITLLRQAYLDYEGPAISLGMPLSSERAALVSLYYNRGGNLEAKMPEFFDAVRSGNRAEAWYEMRYMSWGKRTVDEPGLRARRLIESNVFGLYDNDPPSANEARSVYKMLTSHRDQILQLEALWGVSPDGTSGTRNLVAEVNTDNTRWGTLDAVTLVEALTPARDAFIGWVNSSGLLEGQPNLVAEQWNPAAIYYNPNAKNSTLDARSDDGKGGPDGLRLENNLLVGSDGADILYGGTGDDVLIGSAGGDKLVGGAGADILIGGTGFTDVLSGGAGDDTYVFKTGDGIDKIVGESESDVNGDDDGKIIYDGIELTGSNAKSIIDFSQGDRPSWVWTEGGATFHATLMDGDLTNGGTLWISKGGDFGTDRIVIENFKPDDLGLNLDAALTCQLLPDTFTNPFTNESYTPTTLSTSLMEGGSRMMTVALNTPAVAGQKVLIGASGLLDVLFIVTGAEELSLSNGGVELTLEAGQTSITFELLERGDIDSDADFTLTATVRDADGQAVGDAASLHVALQASSSVTPENAETIYKIGEVTIVDESGQPAGSWYGRYSYGLRSDGTYTPITDVDMDIFGQASYFKAASVSADPSWRHSEYIDDRGDYPAWSGGTVAILGGLGDSYIVGTEYRDVITDGVNDTFRYDGYIYENGAWVPASLPGYLYGNDKDVLIGGLGGDVLFTHGGDDRAEGDEGNDVLIDWAVSDSSSHAYSDHSWFDTAGNSNNDQLRGGSGNDLMVAGGGNALMEGGDGADELYAGADDDTLLGGEGDDVLWGDGQRARMDVWTGIDYVDAWTNHNNWLVDWIQPAVADPNVKAYDWSTTVTDTLTGNVYNYQFHGIVEATSYTGKDFLDGGNGNDELRGGGSSDVLYGGADNDTLLGDAVGGDAVAGDDYLNGEDGDDQLKGMAGADTLIGGVGDDALVGDGDEVGAEYQGNDYLDAGAGNDYLWGNGGNDTLLGGDGNDYLQGDATSTPESVQGNDYLDGGAGNDTLVGDAGNDTLLGGAGNDELSGGKGDDYLAGGVGTDHLWGGEGDDILETGPTGNLLASGDVLQGGAGDDTYILNEGMGSVRIEDSEGENSLVFGGASGQIGVQMVDGLIVLTLENGDNIVMSAATANTMDNGLYSSKLVENSDGSTVATITTYASDGGSTAYEFANSTDGALTQTNRYYDSNNSLTRRWSRTPDGATIDKNYVYGEDGSKTVTTVAVDAVGASTTTLDQFDVDGLLAQKTVTKDGGSTTYHYHYDGVGVLTDRVANASDGTQTTTFYNATGQVVSREVIATSGQVTETFYGSDGEVTEKVVIKNDGTVTTYYYNQAGEYSLVEQVNTDGSTSSKTYAYRVDGSKTITDVAVAPGVPGSTVTVSDYDALGQLTHKLETNPDGSTVDRTIVYAADGAKAVTMVSVVSGATTTTVFDYDAAGKLVDKVLTQPDGTVINYDFTADSRVSHSFQTNPDGSSVDRAYSYSANGAYVLVVAAYAAGSWDATTTTYSYDALERLRGKEVSNPDGTSITYLYNSLGRLTDEYTHNLDGSLTTEKYAYQPDGSKTSVVVSTLDGDQVGQYVSKSFDAAGTLRSKHVVGDDGGITDYRYDAAGRLVGFDQYDANGAAVEKTYVYGADGSKIETVATTAAGEGTAKVVTNYYDVAGVLTGRQVTNTDGSTTLNQYNADGSIAASDTHNVDGSYVIKSYVYHGDGSKTVTVDTIPSTGGAGRVVVYQYDVAGVQTGRTVAAETSTVENDAAGKTTTHYFAPNGFETHATWQHTDGSFGEDSFGRDGSSFGFKSNSDESYSKYRDDGHGNVTTTSFDANDVKTGVVWQRSDGSSGTDAFFVDGSSEGYATYSDGSTNYFHDDGAGYRYTNYYDVSGMLVRDEYQQPDGSSGTTVYAPDGSAISGTWSDGNPGDYGTWALQPDGTWLEQYTDGSGYSYVTRYDADYNNQISSHEEYADGRVSDYVRYADGSWVSTWAAPDGSFGFQVYNGETSESRGLDYSSLNNWVAWDQIKVSVGVSGIESILSVARDEWDGDVRYYDNASVWATQFSNVAGRIVTDTDFGLDPLRGLILSPVDNGDGYDMDVSMSADALLVYSSDMAKSYIDSDPFASVHSLIASDGASYGDFYSTNNTNDVRGISFNSDDLSLNGYITFSGLYDYLRYYRYHGVNGTDGYWNYDPNDPIYVPNSGGSGGGGFHSGKGLGGSYAGGFGTTTQYIGDGYVEYGNGTQLPVSAVFGHNSSIVQQTTFTGSGPLEG